MSRLLFTSALITTLLASWLGLFLAETGSFSLPPILAGTALVGAAACWRGVRLARPAFSRADVPLLALLGAAALVFLRPHELILGGADAGVYLNAGVHLARSGALLIRDPLLPDLRPEALPELLRAAQPVSGVDWLRFPGLYVEDLGAGQVTPQFFSLQTVWVAIFYAIGGLPGALSATPLMGLLGLAAVYMTAHTLFEDRRLAFTAALLLACTPTQIWFSRYPTAEALTQFLTFGGLYAFTRAMQSPQLGWPALAGAALGTVFITRPDAFPLLAPAAAYLAFTLISRKWQSRETVFFLVMTLCIAYSGVHALLFVRPYTITIFQAVAGVGMWLLQRAGWLLALGALAVAWLGWLIWRGGWQRVEPHLAQWHRQLGLLLAAGLILAALYAYFVRPVTEEQQSYFYWYGQTTLRTYDAQNLVRLGWYLSPLGLLLGVAGYAVLLVRGLSRRTWFFASFALIFSIVYIWNVANNPHHIYAMRRYVPVVIPSLCIAIAYSLNVMWVRFSDRWLGRLVLLGTALALLLQLGYADRVVAQHVEYAGITRQVAALTASLPEDSVTIFADTDVGNAVGTPLQYVFDRQSFALQRPDADPQTLGEQVNDWWLAGRPVFWVVGTASSVPPPGAWPVWKGTHIIDVPVLEQSYDRFPAEVLRWQAEMDIYELVPPDSRVLSLTIDVGGHDLAALRSGFYGKEVTADGTTFRWTQAEAHLTLPADPEGKYQLRLRMAEGRPSGVTPSGLSLRCSSMPLEIAPLSPGFAVYTIDLPPNCRQGGEYPITIASDPWVPRLAGAAQDDRALGIVLDWAELVKVSP